MALARVLSVLDLAPDASAALSVVLFGGIFHIAITVMLWDAFRRRLGSPLDTHMAPEGSRRLSAASECLDR